MTNLGDRRISRPDVEGTITGRWQSPKLDGATGGYTYTLERQQ